MDLIITTQENLEEIVKNAVQLAIGVQSTKQAEPKKNLTFSEGLEFLNENGFKISKSHLYKQTMLSAIPCSRFGKKVIFNPSELMEWAEGKTKRRNEINPVTAQVAKSAKRKLERSFAV